jgi:hypothetical protein
VEAGFNFESNDTTEKLTSLPFPEQPEALALISHVSAKMPFALMPEFAAMTAAMIGSLAVTYDMLPVA